MDIKSTVMAPKGNVLGALLGAGAGFLAAKKLIKTEKKWVLISTVLVGAIVGANIEAKSKAKSSVLKTVAAKKIAMTSAATKIKSSVVAAPFGAATGLLFGYLISERLGYNKSLTVMSFGIVGLIIGAELTKAIKK